MNKHFVRKLSIHPLATYFFVVRIVKQMSIWLMQIISDYSLESIPDRMDVAQNGREEKRNER